MPATLLVLDIDGTLRPHGEPRVPKENADALHTVQKAGVKLVIATGRCRAEIPAKMLRGIRPDYWICAAGAQVEDAAGQIAQVSAQLGQLLDQLQSVMDSSRRTVREAVGAVQSLGDNVQ